MLFPGFSSVRPSGVHAASGARISGHSDRAIRRNRFDNTGATIDNKLNVDILYPVESAGWIFYIRFVSLIISKKNDPHNIVIRTGMDFFDF